MKYFFILILVLAGCGKATTDPKLVDEVERFIAAGQSRGVDLTEKARSVSIRFKKLSNQVLGECNSDLLGSEVVIESAITDPWLLRTVLSHELGHCLLGKQHNDSIHDGKPDSLMYRSPKVTAPYMVGEEKAYLDELFAH